MSEKKTEVVEITIKMKIKGKEITLTTDEAKKLQLELNRILNSSCATTWPWWTTQTISIYPNTTNPETTITVT